MDFTNGANDDWTEGDSLSNFECIIVLQNIASYFAYDKILIEIFFSQKSLPSCW